MNRRMLTNDFKRNKLITITTCVFMAVSATFIGLTVLLSGSLLTSIDDLMAEAKTCDFLQMHSGEIDEEALQSFAAEQDEVDQMQICTMLNIENGIIALNGRSLSDNNQDNGLCVQSERFDFLLGMDSELIHPKAGQVYAPVCYREEYGLKAGQTMEIGSRSLSIAGFLRDSQMNSMMASSKRFLVSREDYERFRDMGSEEYLIEFLLKEGSDTNTFANAYTKAGLPSNGPTITAPLIRMMNALSDGLMILVILMVGVIVLIISLICIRYIVLTGIEKDRREVGMLKAIGISAKDRRKIYLSKYLLLSGAGGIIGLILAAILSKPLGAQMRELYGASGDKAWPAFAALAAVVVTEGVLLFSIRRNLKKSEKVSAVDALRGTSGQEKRRKGKPVLIAAVLAACVVLMLVPLNLSGTISSDKFVTYMGIGDSQIRMDIRQSDEITSVTGRLMRELDGDSRVEEYAVMQTKNCSARIGELQETGEHASAAREHADAARESENENRKNSNAAREHADAAREHTDTTREHEDANREHEAQVNLLVEFGDHEIFPLTYSEGKAPTKPGEIALSNLNAEELGCDLGDTMMIRVNGTDQEYTVCGIYSDITNGGKTAKAWGDPREILKAGGDLQENREEGSGSQAWKAGDDLKEPKRADDDPVMWSIVYVTLEDGESVSEWMEEYREEYRSGNSSVKIVDIAQYMDGTYGQTIRRIRNASRVSILAALLIIFIVVVLFVRLMIWQERSDSSLKKALGLQDADIRKEYMKRVSCFFVIGIVFGVILAITAGQKMAGVLLSLLGASGFHFIVDYRMACIVIPAAALAAAMLAAGVSLREIRKIRAFECCVGRE